MSRRSWHRRASRPILLWMIALIVFGLTHPLIPNYRWVLIHAFTLGVVTNSIVIWSQHLTEKFLQQRAPDSARSGQLRRIWLLNIGIIVTTAGQMLIHVSTRHWIITHLGATLVSLALVWHAASVGRQWLAAEKTKRFRPAVAAYVASSLTLPVGAILGGWLAMAPDSVTDAAVRASHVTLLLGGFVGLAAAASLTVLFPAIWRTQGTVRFAPLMLTLVGAGPYVAVSGFLLRIDALISAGLLLALAGWVLGAWSWVSNIVKVAADPRDRVSYPALAISLGLVWLIGALALYTTQHLLGLHPSPPTLALLVGFAAQLLLGTMSYLLPTTMGGGPKASAAGLAVLGRGGGFRLALTNLGLVFWLISSYSWLKVAMSLLALGALAYVAVLLPLAVKAQVRVLRKEAETPATSRGVSLNQVTAGIAVIALVLAAFGGIHGPIGPGVVTSQEVTGDENVTEVEVAAKNMVFSPDLVEVPAGDHLYVVITNTDSMAHDLKFANGAQSGRLKPGESARLDLGVVTEDIEGWCTIAGHKAQGMIINVVVTD